MIIKNLFCVTVFFLGMFDSVQLEAMKNNKKFKTEEALFLRNQSEKKTNFFCTLTGVLALSKAIKSVKEKKNYSDLIQDVVRLSELGELALFGYGDSSGNIFNAIATVSPEKMSCEEKMEIIRFAMDVVFLLKKDYVAFVCKNVEESGFFNYINDKDILHQKDVISCNFFFTTMGTGFVKMFFEPTTFKYIWEYLKSDIDRELFYKVAEYHSFTINAHDEETKETVLDRILGADLSIDDKLAMINFLFQNFIKVSERCGQTATTSFWMIAIKSLEDSLSTAGSVFKYVFESTTENEKERQLFAQRFFKEVVRSEKIKKYMWFFVIEAWNDVVAGRLKHQSKSTDQLFFYIVREITGNKKAILDNEVLKHNFCLSALNNIVSLSIKNGDQKLLDYLTSKHKIKIKNQDEKQEVAKSDVEKFVHTLKTTGVPFIIADKNDDIRKKIEEACMSNDKEGADQKLDEILKSAKRIKINPTKQLEEHLSERKKILKDLSDQSDKLKGMFQEVLSKAEKFDITDPEHNQNFLLTEISSGMSLEDIKDKIEKRFGDEIKFLNESCGKQMVSALIWKNNRNVITYFVDKNIMNLQQFFYYDDLFVFDALIQKQYYDMFDYCLQYALDKKIMLEEAVINHYVSLVIESSIKNKTIDKKSVKRLALLAQLSKKCCFDVSNKETAVVKLVLEALELCKGTIDWYDTIFQQMDPETIESVLKIGNKKSFETGWQKLKVFFDNYKELERETRKRLLGLALVCARENNDIHVFLLACVEKYCEKSDNMLYHVFNLLSQEDLKYDGKSFITEIITSSISAHTKIQRLKCIFKDMSNKKHLSFLLQEKGVHSPLVAAVKLGDITILKLLLTQDICFDALRNPKNGINHSQLMVLLDICNDEQIKLILSLISDDLYKDLLQYEYKKYKTYFINIRTAQLAPTVDIIEYAIQHKKWDLIDAIDFNKNQKLCSEFNLKPHILFALAFHLKQESMMKEAFENALLNGNMEIIKEVIQKSSINKDKKIESIYQPLWNWMLNRHVLHTLHIIELLSNVKDNDSFISLDQAQSLIHYLIHNYHNFEVLNKAINNTTKTWLYAKNVCRDKIKAEERLKKQLEEHRTENTLKTEQYEKYIAYRLLSHDERRPQNTIKRSTKLELPKLENINRMLIRRAKKRFEKIKEQLYKCSFNKNDYVELYVLRRIATPFEERAREIMFTP